MNEHASNAFLAIDIGASSGRAILGTIQNNRLELKEISRFENPLIEIHNRLYWDVFHLYSEIIKSLKQIKADGITISSVGIDTWGVDFVCFGKDGEPLRTPYSYRDTRNFGATERFFEKRISKEELYKKTGIQIMNINSLFQLSTQLDYETTTYPLIDKVLFMPDALSYLLTGNMVTEYTIASTSQMINPYKREFDESILKSINLTKDNFAPIVFSGTKIGHLSDSVQKQTGLDEIPVVAVAGHDTGAAVLAVPAENERFAYLSSGTWSLMGIESAEPIITDETFRLNFTNEGGADGSVRLLKNICGMWLVEQCKKEWDDEKVISYDEIVQAAKEAKPFQSFFNPDSPCFASPASMIDAIKDYCRNTGQSVPESMGEIARCIYESLAFRYKQVLSDLQELAEFPIETLHIIGGGAKNKLLNQFTANAINKPTVAGPSEATAMGNILLQAKAAGLVKDKKEIRQISRDSVELEVFQPQETEIWESNYKKFLQFYTEI